MLENSNGKYKGGNGVQGGSQAGTERATITEKHLTVTAKELVYILSLIIALVGQWFSHKAALSEAVLNLKGEQALLKLEVSMLKAQIEKLEHGRR